MSTTPSPLVRRTNRLTVLSLVLALFLGVSAYIIFFFIF